MLQFQGYIYKMLQAKSEEEVNQLGNALENNLEVGTSAQLFLDKALGIHSPVHPSCKCGVIQFCAMEARSSWIEQQYITREHLSFYQLT